MWAKRGSQSNQLVSKEPIRGRREEDASDRGYRLLGNLEEPEVAMTSRTVDLVD